jgi:hypothetical protein
MRMLIVVVVCTGCEAPLCEAIDQIVVRGDLVPLAGSSVQVSQSEADGRVVIEAAVDGATHAVEFETLGTEMDELVGDVGAEFGGSIVGEGVEVIYLRVIDERGVWFEGGRSPTFDDSKGGGADLQAPFSIGDSTGERCRVGEQARDVFGVHVAFDDGVVDARPEGVSGVLAGLSMRAFGMRAEKGSFVATQDAIDGYAAGPHAFSDIVSYVFRTR